MTSLLVFLSAINGLLWRRMYGGWLGISRTLLLIIATILFSSAAWELWHDSHTWWVALIFTAIIPLQFCLGVQFDNFWLCLIRYELGPVAIFCFTGQWWWTAIAPVIALTYYLGRINKWPALNLPWDTSTDQMIDGYAAYGECVVGLTNGIMFVAAPLLCVHGMCYIPFLGM